MAALDTVFTKLGQLPFDGGYNYPLSVPIDRNGYVMMLTGSSLDKEFPSFHRYNSDNDSWDTLSMPAMREPGSIHSAVYDAKTRLLYKDSTGFIQRNKDFIFHSYLHSVSLDNDSADKIICNLPSRSESMYSIDVVGNKLYLCTKRGIFVVDRGDGLDGGPDGTGAVQVGTSRDCFYSVSNCPSKGRLILRNVPRRCS